jgi:outer membrane protein assembly factor BamB
MTTRLPTRFLRRPLLLLLLSLPLTAQADAPPVLLGNRLLDGKELNELATLPHGAIVHPEHRVDGTVATAAGLVDPARSLLLAADGKNLRLSRLPGALLWQRDTKELGLADPVPLAQAVLAAECVVLPDAEGRLLALAVADGSTLWRTRETGHSGLVQDGLLVAALASAEKRPVARAFALANGARACEVPAPAYASRLVLGPHGIAVTGSGTTRVFDRSGPELFQFASATKAVHADTSGFYAITDEALFAFDRNGKERWRQAQAIERFVGCHLTTTASGLVVTTTFLTFSDDGAQLIARDPTDGAIVWQRNLPELGVPHSKYWHHVVAWPRGTDLFVASHGAGGQWLMRLDAATGEQHQRISHTK